MASVSLDELTPPSPGARSSARTNCTESNLFTDVVVQTKCFPPAILRTAQHHTRCTGDRAARHRAGNEHNLMAPNLSLFGLFSHFTKLVVHVENGNPGLKEARTRLTRNRRRRRASARAVSEPNRLRANCWSRTGR
jgi:hypothetical protein